MNTTRPIQVHINGTSFDRLAADYHLDHVRTTEVFITALKAAVTGLVSNIETVIAGLVTVRFQARTTTASYLKSTMMMCYRQD